MQATRQEWKLFQQFVREYIREGANKHKRKLVDNDMLQIMCHIQRQVGTWHMSVEVYDSQHYNVSIYDNHLFLTHAD